MESPARTTEQCPKPDELARHNWRRNLDALRDARHILPGVEEGVRDVEWLFARDGSLTALLPGERWWAGCSLPRRAARFMLKKLDVSGTVACFLAPAHAAQLREALERLEPTQAVVALVPDARTARVILHCDDFADEISSGRLWFAAGAEWTAALNKLFDDHPGLPTPAQFIRPILADPGPADALIGPAQTVFNEVNDRRASRIQSLAAAPARETRARPRICVLAPSRFRLWSNAGRTLAETLEAAGVDVVRLDPDQPASASPLAFALALADCDGIVAADVGRADVPALAAFNLKWISWVTTPRIPPAESAGPHDALIVANRGWIDSAHRAGWPAERIHEAGWPAPANHRPLASPPARLAIIADTRVIEIPDAVAEYSSQVLMWEAIENELSRDPFALGPDIDRYLDAKIAAFGIAAEGFARALFVEQLIVPAWQQGLARLLMSERLPLRLLGRGWDEIEAFARHADGPVDSPDELTRAIDNAAALVHAWPARHAHPIDAAGRPIVYPTNRSSFLHDCRSALARPQADPSTASEALLENIMRSILNGGPAGGSSRTD